MHTIKVQNPEPAIKIKDNGFDLIEVGDIFYVCFGGETGLTGPYVKTKWDSHQCNALDLQRINDRDAVFNSRNDIRFFLVSSVELTPIKACE